MDKYSPLLSILDRLLDEAPGVPEAPVSQGSSELKMMQGVQRDLEHLLNCRQYILNYPRELDQYGDSLYKYGLPDFTAVNFSSDDGRENFRRIVEKTIQSCELRFKKVNVRLLENIESVDRTLRFHIDALLKMDPAPEPIVFDTRIEPVTGNLKVETE